MTNTIRIGLIGAGDNMRKRHIPGFNAISGVELTAVCNRRPESTDRIAAEYAIPKTYAHWEELVADKDIDAICIGTWPYLHCPITLAALAAGKHVLTEARMAMNASEAHQMLAAAKKYPDLTTQIVPSPFGLKGDRYVKQLLRDGYLGELREVHIYGRSGLLADPATPLSWRQDGTLSGYNMLTLGILHETMLRWLPPPVQVMAQHHAFIPTRIDPQGGVRRPVGTPDSVQVLSILKDDTSCTYHFSAATPFGRGHGVEMFGTEGVLVYDPETDQMWGANREHYPQGTGIRDLSELSIPDELCLSWQVEADFVRSIREGDPVEFTDFATGVAYMEFTEAVVRSAREGIAVELPLEEFLA